MAAERDEGGDAPARTEWVAETTRGEPPTDPSWNLYSDTVASQFDGEPDANVEAIRGTGSPDDQAYFTGSETHEYDFVYHMQQWFVDGSGDTVDPSWDAINRASDGGPAATHTVVDREVHDDGGTAGGGRHIYRVGLGGVPAAAEWPYETDTGVPVEMTLTYQFERVRLYDVSQPSSSTTLTVSSTSANDDSQTLTLEDDGAGTSEDVSLAGTTDVTTSASFASIDAAWLDAETEGDITVADGSNTLLTISGQDSYESGEGDRGIPALGAGSHASAIGSDYVTFNGTDLTKSSGFTPDEITGGSASVDQNVDTTARVGTASYNIHPTNRSITTTLDMAGTHHSVDRAREYLQGTESNIVWNAPDHGTLTFTTGRMMSPGTVVRETDTHKLVGSVEYQCKDISAST